MRWRTLVLLVLAATPSVAWTPPTYQAVAIEVLHQAPPDVRRQLDRHRREVLRGAIAPLAASNPVLREKNPDGSGQLDAAVLQATRDLAAAVETMQPFEEIAYRVGVLCHYATLANDPTAVAQADAAEGRFRDDWGRYVARAQGRFALVFYADEPRVDTWTQVRQLVGRAIGRGRSLYPLLGREYRRIDFRSGVLLFDDRSTAFGVGAITFSHAVTDSLRLVRWAWLEGGGGDSGSPAELGGLGRVVVLPRQAR